MGQKSLSVGSEDDGDDDRNGEDADAFGEGAQGRADRIVEDHLGAPLHAALHLIGNADCQWDWESDDMNPADKLIAAAEYVLDPKTNPDYANDYYFGASGENWPGSTGTPPWSFPRWTAEEPAR